VFYTIIYSFFNTVLFLCMRSLTIFVLMWRWFNVRLLIVFNLIYSYDMLCSLCQCTLRIDESEISYVHMIYVCVCMHACLRRKFQLLQSVDWHSKEIKQGRNMVNLHPHRTTVVHKFCITDRKARLNFVNWYLRKVLAEQIHHTFICLVTKIGFISADTSFKMTATGLQKIPCGSAQCHYMMIQLVCGVLRVWLLSIVPSIYLSP
jgi:hypothetical protein